MVERLRVVLTMGFCFASLIRRTSECPKDTSVEFFALSIKCAELKGRIKGGANIFWTDSSASEELCVSSRVEHGTMRSADDPVRIFGKSDNQRVES